MGCGGSSETKGSGPAGGGSKAGGGKSDLSKPVAEGGIGHAQFISDNAGKLTEVYKLDSKILGEGSYGSVRKGTHNSTQQIRAVKTIAKAQMKNMERFRQEIGIMKMMDHPNIIKLYETFSDNRNIYLVMELCDGGELFDRIIDAGHFTEEKAAMLMKQIIQALHYMHNQKVCHRDLKPENFIFVSKDPIEKNLLKIIDFGLSCKCEEGQTLSTKAGTPYYVAPQVLSGKYDLSSDLWSCGVIMYVLLCGYPPFFGDTDSEVLAKVKLGNFSFNAADWKNVSEDAKNLIRAMLTMAPKDRFTAEQALNHVWIKDKAPNSLKDVKLQEGLVQNLQKFRSTNKLKKAALHIIALQLNESQIKALREVFQALDSNNDGQLSVAEMKQGIDKAGLKDIPPDLERIMKEVDSDGSGNIDYTEFLAATLDQKTYIREDVCWSAFRVFDKNGDGKISPDELKQVLGDGSIKEVAGGETIATMMQELDKNGDGMIDFDEFMTMMKGAQGSA